MGKLRAITKEVNLKEFRRRGCTACGNLLMVESTGGRTRGKYGNSNEKLLTCKTCDVHYWYDWNFSKEKYCINHISVYDGLPITLYIDYSINCDFFEKFNLNKYKGPKDKDSNVLVHIANLNNNTYIFLDKIFSLPKKRIMKFLKEKIEIYTVFV